MDTINYILFTNPISSGVAQYAKEATSFIVPKTQIIEMPTTKIVTERTPLYKLVEECGLPVVRIAGISGALAVALGAYGAHKTYPKDNLVELKRIFETASKYHLIHSTALAVTPLCRFPVVSASLFIVGMVLFCGPCYFHAFTNVNKFGRFAPIGGSCLILGWLSMVV